MKIYIKYCFYLIITILIVSCSSSNKKTTTYFGGKIINPKSSYVLLYSQEKLVDSLLLDANDRFIGTYSDLKEGLYYFVHGRENQYVYIQPNDSISVRLNTWDFDESIVFDGNGAEKNNILIDFFLESEKERRNYSLYSFYSLDPMEFKSKLDSVMAKKQQKIDLFKKSTTNLSDKYLHILDVFVKYPIYNRFEYYTESNRKRNKRKDYITVDSSFYDYRKLIDINNKSLMYIKSYSNYVIGRIYNGAFTKGFYDTESKEFTVALLNSVEKNITKEDLKNTLLKQMLLNDFIENSTSDYNKEAFYTFFKLSTDIEDKKHIQRLINDLKKLLISEKLPEFNVFNYNNSKKDIRELTKNKNSVIFFWNPKYYSKNALVKRMNYLTEKHPKVYFISVKTDYVDENHASGFDIKNQFYLNEDSKANLFLTSKLPRTLLVNKKGVIKNSFASLHRYTISKQIEDLEKN